MVKNNRIRLLACVISLLVLLAPMQIRASAATDPIQVYLGGMPFGVRFHTGELTISSITAVDGADGEAYPARDAGLSENDVILEINGTPISSAEEISEAVENCDGATIRLLCRRDKKEFETTIRPILSESAQKYRIGIWMKDSSAGIGTVTYIAIGTGGFGGLGHGICDADGNLLGIDRGAVTDVSISDIKRGMSGVPGELHGLFSSDKIGTVMENTDCGVFGILSGIGEFHGETITLGTKDDIHSGKAILRCTLTDNVPKEYEVLLTLPENTDTQTRCFKVKVTDPALLEQTGGIVQGMSGSPIIQDGLLVGAVTHVMVSDPSEGYGIFAENMFETMPEILK